MSDESDAVFGNRTPARPSFVSRVAPEQTVLPPLSQEEAEGDGSYRAFGFFPTAVGEVCELRSWLDGTDVVDGMDIQYRFLIRVRFTGDEQLRLVLPDCLVIIDGRRLSDLRKKLRQRTVTFIQQFHARLWPSPGASECVVDRITIVEKKEENAG